MIKGSFKIVVQTLFILDFDRMAMVAKWGWCLGWVLAPPPSHWSMWSWKHYWGTIEGWNIILDGALVFTFQRFGHINFLSSNFYLSGINSEFTQKWWGNKWTTDNSFCCLCHVFGVSVVCQISEDNVQDESHPQKCHRELCQWPYKCFLDNDRIHYISLKSQCHCKYYRLNAGVIY